MIYTFEHKCKRCEALMLESVADDDCPQRPIAPMIKYHKCQGGTSGEIDTVCTGAAISLDFMGVY